jgi:hypothetical protein
MHQAAIRSLGLVEDKLRRRSPERKATYYEDEEKENPNPRKAKQASHQATKSARHEGRMQGIL